MAAGFKDRCLPVGVVFLLLTLLTTGLHVDVVPHSHCDPGWIVPFEEYYVGDVVRILNSVIDALEMNPERRFVWAETSYLARWWRDATPTRRNSFTRAVAVHQLELIGSGWVMPDEATTHWLSLIDNISVGHGWIVKQFGVRPHIGWQIDPFGASSATPRLWSAMGFDLHVMNRFHYVNKHAWASNGHSEFLWGGSKANPIETPLWTHVIQPHYDSPRGFGFENSAGVGVRDENVSDRASLWASIVRERSSGYPTSNLLYPFGDDFQFSSRDRNFENMDKLLDYVNSRYITLSGSYSTITEYINKVSKAGVAFPLHYGDFFPYADEADAYWTGFYTSYPVLKQRVRDAEVLLRATDTAFALARTVADSQSISQTARGDLNWRALYQELDQSRRDIVLLQHHDGITGTSRRSTILDYTNRLREASSALKHVFETSLDILQPPGGEGWTLVDDSSQGGVVVPIVGYTAASVEEVDEAFDKHTRPNSIYSKEPTPTEREEHINDVPIVIPQDPSLEVPVTVYNGQGRPRLLTARFLVNSPRVVIQNPGYKGFSQIQPVWDAEKKQWMTDRAELFVTLSVPPLGSRTLYLSSCPDTACQDGVPAVTISHFYRKSTSAPATDQTMNGWEVEWSRPLIQSVAMPGSYVDQTIVLSHESGLPTGVTRSKRRVRVDMSIKDLWTSGGAYIEKTSDVPFTGSGSKVNSAPNHPEPPTEQWTTLSDLWVFQGPVMSQSLAFPDDRPRMAPMVRAYHVTSERDTPEDGDLYPGLHDMVNAIEITVSVYPKEKNHLTMLEMRTDIPSDGTWMTSNGHEWEVRTRNEFETHFPANTYPSIHGGGITSSRGIAWHTPRRSAWLLTAQPTGVSSIQDGTLQVVLHRKTAHDDGRGVGQPVTDPSSVTVPMYLWIPDFTSTRPLGPYPDSYMRAQLCSDLFARPLVAVGSPMSSFECSAPPLMKTIPTGLPDGLEIAALRVNDAFSSDVLFRVHDWRLLAHSSVQYGPGYAEHLIADPERPLNLKEYFGPTWHLGETREMDASGVSPRPTVHPRWELPPGFDFRAVGTHTAAGDVVLGTDPGEFRTVLTCLTIGVPYDTSTWLRRSKVYAQVMHTDIKHGAAGELSPLQEQLQMEYEWVGAPDWDWHVRYLFYVVFVSGIYLAKCHQLLCPSLFARKRGGKKKPVRANGRPASPEGYKVV